MNISFKSYTKTKRFIVTTYPREEDTVDFLRMLNDHESNTVVCMDPIKEINSVQLISLFCLISAYNIFTIYIIIDKQIILTCLHFCSKTRALRGKASSRSMKYNKCIYKCKINVYYMNRVLQKSRAYYLHIHIYLRLE